MLPLGYPGAASGPRYPVLNIQIHPQKYPPDVYMQKKGENFYILSFYMIW